MSNFQPSFTDSITAKIANFRKVEWESLSINFVMVFSPNTFAGAPHAWLATARPAAASPRACKRPRGQLTAAPT